MKTSPLSGLVIRTAIVRRPDLGFIYACDPKLEAEEVPHTIIFKWKAGTFIKGDCEYDAHTVCAIEKPEPSLVDASGPGFYTINARSGKITSDIFQDSQPPPKKRRIGGIRSVAEIQGKAYAVGLRGMVYRLDKVRLWQRIDEGLPETFNIQASHGFQSSDIYAVGRFGQLWQYNGEAWRHRELPTNVNLTSVKCAEDGNVYVAGHAGVLLRGRLDKWDVIDHKATNDDIWDVEWFDGKLFVSTFKNVYRLNGKDLEPINFGTDKPKSCYQLSAANGVMWSNGEFDVMSFDGRTWTRVV